MTPSLEEAFEASYETEALVTETNDDPMNASDASLLDACETLENQSRMGDFGNGEDLAEKHNVEKSESGITETGDDPMNSSDASLLDACVAFENKLMGDALETEAIATETAHGSMHSSDTSLLEACETLENQSRMGDFGIEETLVNSGGREEQCTHLTEKEEYSQILLTEEQLINAVNLDSQDMEIEGEDLAEKHTVEKSESERGDEKTVDCGEHLIEMSMKILEDMVIQDKKVARNILLFLINILYHVSHFSSHVSN